MFCDTCGAEVVAGQKFCPNCGKALGAASGPSEDRMFSHFRLLGIFWIIISAFRLLGGLTVLFVANVVIRAVLRDVPVRNFVPALVSGVGVFLLVGAALGFLAGWGLLQREDWSRLLTLILAFLSLLDVPFGTALGIYSIWALMSAEGERGFARWSSVGSRT
jgi:hypothetical protein